MNIWSGWLFLIGTKQRAEKLLKLLPSLGEPAIAVSGDTLEQLQYRVTTPAICPTQVLFGQQESQRIYANPWTRPALDAWDTGLVGRQDIAALCRYIISGRYAGASYKEHVSKRKQRRQRAA